MPQVDSLVKVFYPDLDLVIIEGLKTDQGLKLEVCRPDYSDRAVCPPSELLATYGADLFGYKLPHFDYGDEQKLGEHVVNSLDRLRKVESPLK